MLTGFLINRLACVQKPLDQSSMRSNTTKKTSLIDDWSNRLAIHALMNRSFFQKIKTEIRSILETMFGDTHPYQDCNQLGTSSIKMKTMVMNGNVGKKTKKKTSFNGL